jgi:hypothetical protein
LAVALLLPLLARADPLPSPPAGETHLPILAGQRVLLQCPTDPCPPVYLASDPADPRFGGVLTPPALARYDLDRLHRIEAERDAALKVAYAAPPPGLKLLGIGLGVGITAGGTAAAWAVDGSKGVKIAATAGSAALGALLVFLFR